MREIGRRGAPSDLVSKLRNEEAPGSGLRARGLSWNQIAEQLGIGRGTVERAYKSLSQNPFSHPTAAGHISQNLSGLAMHAGPFSPSSVIGKDPRLVADFRLTDRSCPDLSS
jgi:hypothetical protein